MMLWKCCSQYARIFGKLSSGHRTEKGQFLIPISEEGNAKECLYYHTIVLISHASNVMLKILQARLEQYMNWEHPNVQAGFRKGRGTKDKIANIHWIIEKAREFQKNIYFCFIAGDFSHKIKSCLFLGGKAMTNLDSISKSRNIADKGHLLKAMVFPVVMYGCVSWTKKKAECQRIDAFQWWCWIRHLRVPWTLKPVHPKGNHPWIFIGRTDAVAEVPIPWSLCKKS